MSLKPTVKDNFENSKENLKKDFTNFDHEFYLNKIRKEVLQKFSEYKKTLDYMATDAPIQILCLPKPIENALLSNGLLRIYDILDMDFTKVKGLGIRRIRDLASRLDEFLSML